MIMDRTWEFVLRLFVAGILGAVIGFDREYRAKEAGTRTHFLVSLGSALIMIVSQWGFQDVVGAAGGVVKLDPSRVAAQVVSGIGFIGAGTIMMQKQFVRGLTTATGVWAVSGIGLAIGGGLYILGIAATVLTLVGLEVLRFFLKGIRTKTVSLVFQTKNSSDLIRITNELNANGYHVQSYSVSAEKNSNGELFKVKMTLREHEQRDSGQLFDFMEKFPELVIEKIE